jgi:hypothetical protein
MKALLIIISLFFISQLHAAPQRFDFVYQGVGNTAEANGFIVFESTLLPNPTVGSDNFIILPDPSVLALEVTITGSAGGDGTFTLADFGQYAFATADTTLDLTTELIGQATSGGSWGTPDGSSGDFNLFGGGQPARSSDYQNVDLNAIRGVGSPPIGSFYFTLTAGGGGNESMLLSSFGPFAVVPVPAINNYSVMILILIVFALVVFFNRRKLI